MFFFLETEVKHRLYELQKETDAQRLLQKKKESALSTEKSLSTVKSFKKSKPLMSN